MCALGLVSGIGLAGPVGAAPTTDDPAAAEALFKQARKLVDAGDDAAGCPKFAASLALHASASTALNIAQCHERAGELASAWAAYHTALTLNQETRGEQRRRGLAALAEKGIAALEPRVPRLRVVIEGAPAGLEVRRDGEVLPATALNEPLPVDPGSHEIVASAPGRREAKRVVELAEGQTETVTLDLTVAAALDVKPEPRRARVPAWAWASGGVGLGLLGASVAFLVDDLAAIRALRAHCSEVPGGTYCDPRYDFAADNARKNRDLGLFIGLGSAGLIAVTAGIVGIARAGKHRPPRRAAAAPWLAPGGAGLAIHGRF